MSDKAIIEPSHQKAADVQTGFYVFLGVMGLAFVLMVGYMISLYLS